MTEDSRHLLSEADVFGMFLDMKEVEVLVSNLDFGYRLRHKRQAWVSCLVTEIVSVPGGPRITVQFSNTGEIWERLRLSVGESRLFLTGLAQINERLRKKNVTVPDTTLAPGASEADRCD